MSRLRAGAFTEKAFYLEEFRGRTLVLGIPHGELRRASARRSVAEVTKDLQRCGARTIVVVDGFPKEAVDSFSVEPRTWLGLPAPAGRKRASGPLTRRRARAGTIDLRTEPKANPSQLIRIWQILRRSPVCLVLTGATGVEAACQIATQLRAHKLALIDARERGIRSFFEFDPEASLVLVDRVQIQQVLVNLFRNALEAMAASPERRLAASTRAVAGDMIEISVADTGTGFAEGVQQNLFQTFFTTKETGMGVGLSISRSIVEAHGGKMWAENNAFGGATFHFTLPAAPNESLTDA